MKTRILMIVILTVAAIGLLIGLMAGKRNIPNENLDNADSTKIADRVLNLIILDESGSMHGLEEVSVSGVNETIQTIRSSYEKLPEQKQLITFITFSTIGESQIRTRINFKEIAEVNDYSINDYSPLGGTPLYDAMGSALLMMEEASTDSDIVLVTIITDGYENSSQRFKAEDIQKLVKRLDEKDWVFTYIGANQDAILEAGRLGIRNAMNYDASLDGTREMWEKERSSRERFMEGARKGTVIRRLKENYFNEETEDHE